MCVCALYMQRNLEYEKDLLGTIPFGRFSYAMTSVGDINYDGWDGMFVFVCTTMMTQISFILYVNVSLQKFCEL